MNHILQDTSSPAVGEEILASLTAGERTAWANTRSEFFFKGTNRTSLDAIEKSAFVVALDDFPYEFEEVSILQRFVFRSLAKIIKQNEVWYKICKQIL